MSINKYKRIFDYILYRYHKIIDKKNITLIYYFIIIFTIHFVFIYYIFLRLLLIFYDHLKI